MILKNRKLVIGTLVIIIAMGGLSAWLLRDNRVAPKATDIYPAELRVVAQSPYPGEELPMGGSMEIYFSLPVDQESVRHNLRISPSLAADLKWIDAASLRIVPQPDALRRNTTYTVTFDVGARSTDNQFLAEPATLEFKTPGYLEVSEVVPAPDTQGVDPEAVVTIFFNRPVVPLTLAEEMDNLVQPLSMSPSVAGKGEWLNTSIYTWKPNSPLTGGETYTVTIPKGLIDQSGAVLLSAYEWSFTVKPPRIVSVEPQPDSETVASRAVAKVTFEQPMDPASTQSAFSLTSPTGGQLVGGAFTWDDGKTTMTFTPTLPLTRGIQYTAAISDLAQAANRRTHLKESQQWSFTTLPPPQVAEADYYDYSNQLTLRFNVAMDKTTLAADRVVVSPMPPGGIELSYSDYAWDSYSYLTIWGDFQLNTEYTFTLLLGAVDFEGFAINEPFTYTFTPTERVYEVLQLNASGWETPPFDLYDANRPARAVVMHRGYSRLDFELYRVAPDVLARGWPHRTGGELIRSWSMAADKDRIDVAVERVTLGIGDGKLSPGAYVLVLDAPGYADYGVEDGDIEAAMFVTTATITLKNGPREALAWLTDLSSGLPVAGKEVIFYRWNDDSPTLSGHARTDSDGLASARTPLTTSLPWVPWYGQGDVAIVNDGTTYAVGSTQWSSGITPDAFGVRAGDPQTRSVYVYTDRPIYRPGQEVFFKAVLRDKDDMTYTLPSIRQTQVKVTTGDKTVFTRKVDVSGSGVAEGSFVLPEDADLGEYTVSVDFAEHPDDYFLWFYYGDPGYREGLTSFTVAEYRKPDIQVTVTTEQAQIMSGEVASAVVNATYYFGGPAANVDVKWRVFEYPSSFKYTGPGHFSFYSGRGLVYDDYGFYWGYDDSFYPERIYAEGAGKTDKNGQLAVSFPASLADGAGPSRFLVEATIEEVAGMPVSGRANVWAHPARSYAGVDVEQVVGAEGQERDVKVIVVGWDSKPIRGRTVSIQLVDREWVYETYQDELGQTRSRWSVRETPVGDPVYAVTQEGGMVSLKVTPPRSGSYTVRVTVIDPSGGRSSSIHELWAWGDDPISEPDYDDDNQMEMVADRDSYVPGDQATILINSPFAVAARALVTVERGAILQREVITLPPGASTYTLPITAGLAPNVYFSVVAVAPADPVADFRMGLVELTVTPVEQTLQVVATPLEEFAQPGQEVHYRIEVKDYAGNPVEADLSLALVDKSVLALAELENPSILEAFYRQQPENIFTSVSLVGMVERQLFELLVEQGGMGGGGGKGGPSTIPLSAENIRSEFKDTAYWRASIRTDDLGLAEVTIPLPDNLTTWRLDARALTPDTRVGQTTVDVIATRPLLIRPLTPRFFVARDEATIGAIVNNNTQQDLQVVVSVEGSGLVFKGPLAQQGAIPANTSVQVSWPVTVDIRTQWVDLTFSVQAGDLMDSSKPVLGDPAHGQQLPVYTYQVPETVGTAGQQIVPGSRIEGLMLPQSLDISGGQVRVQIDPSLAATTIDSLDWLEHYPYECIEQTLSRVLPNAVTLRALESLDVDKPALRSALLAQINVGLNRVYDAQLMSGGWGWFDHQANPMVSAYAVHTLVEVSEAGVEVKPSVLAEAVRYLRGQARPVADLSRTSYLNRQAYFLFVLAKAGTYEEEKVDELFEQEEGLSNWGRAMLAQTIWMSNPADPRLDTLRSDLTNAAILSATGAHWEDRHDYVTWTTNTRTTAVVLDTLALVWPDSDQIPSVTRWLMVARQADHWETTQETAWAIIALTDTMQSSGELEADYAWTLSLNDETIGTGKANAHTLTDSQVITLDAADLLAGQVNRLAFQHSNGPGRLYYTTHLTAWLPVERVAALSRGISINRRYVNAGGTPVTGGQAGETLRVEVTLTSERALNYVAVEDYYPAGAEAVDATLLTESEQAMRASLSRADDPLDWGWGWWYLDKAELRDERAVFYAEYLPAGTYQFVYQIRLVVPGVFRVIPPVSWEFYFPEVYGRGDGMLFEIKPAAERQE